MKKGILLITTICLITSSCHKSSTAGTYGSWTIGSMTIPATALYTSVAGSPGTIAIANSPGAATSPATICDMNIMFYDSLPSGSGTYNVIDNRGTLTASNQVQISSRVNGGQGTLYYSTGSGTNQTLSVTFMNGKLDITGNGINMSSTSGNTTLTFDIHQ